MSEYGHCDVKRPVLLNRVLREAGMLSVRRGPFGEIARHFRQPRFAVCDHQLAHVYVSQQQDVSDGSRPARRPGGVTRVLAGANGMNWVWIIPARESWSSCPSPTPGSPIPTGCDDALAPDFARTVDIHRKPGYDPCELFFDPQLLWPKGRAIRRLIQKKLGFRTLFDVVPLDPSLVRRKSWSARQAQ